MHQAPTASEANLTEPHDPTAWVRKLLHRWFVEYNPTYLASAAFVLVGQQLLARGYAMATSAWSQLATTVVCETYGWALIAAAAVLMRAGQRRAAVFVALLAVVYQGDLSLGTERFAFMGTTGAVASAVWLVGFCAKLLALGRAMRIRLSPSAIAVPCLGALSLAVLPHFLRSHSMQERIVAVGGQLFVVAVAALWTHRRIESRLPLEGWPATVMRRTIAATWTLWALLYGFHVAFWLIQFNVPPSVLLPVAAIVLTRWITSEFAVLAWVTATLCASSLEPRLFAFTAWLTGVSLVLAACFRPTLIVDDGGPPARSDYRAAPSKASSRAPSWVFIQAPRDSMIRQLTFASCAAHLAVWAHAWRGSDWPPHVFALDGGLSLLVAWVVWKSRQRSVGLPVFALWVHAAVVAHLIRAPHSTLQWGATSVLLGFAALGGSVLASMRWRPGRQP